MTIENVTVHTKKSFHLMHDLYKLFDIFCKDGCQGQRLEVLHQLQMNERNFAFYSYQTRKRKSRAEDIVDKLNSSAVALKRRSN